LSDSKIKLRARCKCFSSATLAINDKICLTTSVFSKQFATLSGAGIGGAVARESKLDAGGTLDENFDDDADDDEDDDEDDDDEDDDEEDSMGNCCFLCLTSHAKISRAALSSSIISLSIIAIDDRAESAPDYVQVS